MNKQMEPKRIIVCGATGNQGGAVVRYLLKNKKWHVVALTRNTMSSKAVALKALGAELQEADLIDELSLRNAFRGAYGVFGVTQPWSSDYKRCDTQAELDQGINIVSAAKKTNIKHLIMSSVINLYNQPTGVAHADSKLKIEQFINDQNMPYTILRCSQFMENIGSSFFPISKNRIKGFVDADAKVPYVSCEDIGRFTAAIFDRPEGFLERTVSIVGDFISGNEMAKVFSILKSGQRYNYQSAPRLLMRLFAPEFYTMRMIFEKAGRTPYPAAMNHLLSSSRSNFPNTLSLQDYLIKEGYQDNYSKINQS